VSAGAAPFTLRDILLRATDLYGPEPAIICGDVVLSWRELADRTHRVAAWLTAEGVRLGDRVLVLSNNRFECGEVAYAIAELGAVMVPCSPATVGPEIAHHYRDADARLGLAVPELLDRGQSGGGRWLTFGVEDASYARISGEGAAEEPPLVERPEDAVMQYYTSGTTGEPKGVVMSQGALHVHGLNTVVSQGLTHDDVFLSCTPVAHAAAGSRFFSLATEGITHVILPKWSPAAFYAEVARRSVTTSVLVPAMLRDLVWDGDLDDADLSSLRLIVYGAAPTPPDIQAAALERIPAGFLHSYGISEGCPALTVLTPEEHRRALRDPSFAEKLASVGRPVPGVRFKIAGEAGERLPPRQTGEILVRNAKAMSGYWHRPEEEATVWRDGWMATGDSGFVDEQGYLYIVGRKKEMFISGGLNVYPAEVERAIISHPAVRETAVIGAPHPRWGETGVAFVVLTEEVADDELEQHCRAGLSRYKVPSRFIRLEQLPRNQTGKVVRRSLQSIAEDSLVKGSAT
jgi:acyl-CoA synthetase (AMP-forming)/AMP-acid ligase II